MSIDRCASARIEAVLREIHRLMQSEFPYEHPRAALEKVQRIFIRHRNMLGKLSEDSHSGTAKNAYRESLVALQDYLPILGFILRSTNIRNAFEANGPLQRLADDVLGFETRFILSSEWDFSPCVYSGIRHLEEFILVGLPAPESANPLLLPLSGHELGHAVWVSYRLESSFQSRVEDAVLEKLLTDEGRWTAYASLYKYSKQDLGNIFARRTLRPAYTWAMLQASETFCDLLGLRLFAESYLHAFQYLLAPGGGRRSARYPGIVRRIEQMVSACRDMGIHVPVGFTDAFESEPEVEEGPERLLLTLADEASASLTADLLEMVFELARERELPFRKAENVEEICEAFRTWIVPATGERRDFATGYSPTLADILNAGWACYLDEEFLKTTRHRHRILQDLMLKSMELEEFERRGERDAQGGSNSSGTKRAD